MIVLSPAKTLDLESPAVHPTCTTPDFLPFSRDLVSGLKKLSSEEISELMGISTKLAELNRERFLNWKHSPTEKNSKQAILAFKGDVYEGMRAWEFSKRKTLPMPRRTSGFLSGSLRHPETTRLNTGTSVWKWVQYTPIPQEKTCIPFGASG